ncbi:hypothetical protein CSOJ01_08863 [Colletotrichum sojae]|uniref:FAD-binding domain-containing protein n=1 Tax=Colletotrichum sojae TaxID=2175907 RepID=A0A8H6J4W4_9PEZI|nr:hypothetical protein CSOJ01_08863 [Colletotrichum sojae]
MSANNNNSSSGADAKKKLRIVIIGGGIAGLAAAAVLRQRHDVVVYEREAADAPERGAGIGLGPNGSKMLRKAFREFRPERVKATRCSGTRTWDREGNLLREITGVTEPFGGEWLLVHRKDLRDELLRFATVEGGKDGKEVDGGKPARVVWGMGVRGIDVEGKVVLDSGQEVWGDVVIGADGIHSVVRRAVLGPDEPPLTPAGVSLYRFMYPLDKAREVLGGTLPEAIDPRTGGFLNMMDADDELHRNVIFYPCRDFSELNVVARVPDSSDDTSKTSWTANGSREEMATRFADFAPWVLALMKTAEGVGMYRVLDAEPAHTYVKGRAVLIGDAAHPMTPFQGQGATQAVEDAEGLRLLLHDAASDAWSVLGALRTWDSVRRPRAAQVQRNSRRVADLSAQGQLDRMRLNWSYEGIHAALRNR